MRFFRALDNILFCIPWNIDERLRSINSKRIIKKLGFQTEIKPRFSSQRRSSAVWWRKSSARIFATLGLTDIICFKKILSIHEKYSVSSLRPTGRLPSVDSCSPKRGEIDQYEEVDLMAGMFFIIS